MLLNHAVALAACRSYIAALADTALTDDTLLDYHGGLLELDLLHVGPISPITPVPTANRQVIYQVAQETMGRLEVHGLNRFSLAMCQCMLATAWGREHPR